MSFLGPMGTAVGSNKSRNTFVQLIPALFCHDDLLVQWTGSKTLYDFHSQVLHKSNNKEGTKKIKHVLDTSSRGV